MTSDEATVAVIDALESCGVAYMLVGSFASNFHGIPRATQDADFVVHLEGDSLQAVVRSLGPAFRFDPQMSFEMVTGTTRCVLGVVDLPFQIELFLLSEDPHDQARFQRRRRERLLGRETCIPTAEDVIITKLRWSLQGCRAKDVADARNVIAVQRDRLVWEYIELWCDRHGTRRLLEEIHSSVASI